MKILAFSDLHLVEELAADLVTASVGADLVIGAGDFCNTRQGLPRAMEMLAGIAAPMVVVPGNAESAEELRGCALPFMTVLHGQAAEVEGLRDAVGPARLRERLQCALDGRRQDVPAASRSE